MRSENLTWDPYHAFESSTFEHYYFPDGELFELEEPQAHLVALHHIVTIFWTLIGNFLMIFVIFKHNTIMGRRKLTAVQTLLLNLCSSDILYAILTSFSTMLILLTSPIFHGPSILCKIVKLLQVIPLYSSSFLLVAISIDRYYAICRPLANMRASKNRPIIYAFVAWGLSMVASTPQVLIFSKDERGECAPHSSYTELQYQIYILCFNSAVWLFPTILSGVLYGCVCRSVWCSMIYDDIATVRWPNSRSAQSRRSLISRSSTKFSFRSFNRPKTPTPQVQPTEMQNLSLPTSIPTSPNERNDSHTITNPKEEQEKKRVQTVKLTMTIVIANFVLWAPFCIISVIDAFAPHSINPILATHIMFLGNINSMMNPWIWFAFNYDSTKMAIRTAIREFRLRRMRKRQSHDFSLDLLTTASMMMNSAVSP